MTPSNPPTADELREGLRSAFDMYLAETDLTRAVGENGRLFGTVEIHLERGRARWTKGAIYFERRVDFGGTGGR